MEQTEPSIEDPSLVVKVCDTSDPGVLNSIRNEQKILQNLNSKYVNKAFAYYEDPERSSAYLVLEDVGNQTLEQFMKQRAEHLGSPAGLSVGEVRSIMSQLISATYYLHG